MKIWVSLLKWSFHFRWIDPALFTGGTKGQQLGHKRYYLTLQIAKSWVMFDQNSIFIVTIYEKPACSLPIPRPHLRPHHPHRSFTVKMKLGLSGLVLPVPLTPKCTEYLECHYSKGLDCVLKTTERKNQSCIHSLRTCSSIASECGNSYLRHVACVDTSNTHNNHWCYIILFLWLGSCLPQDCPLGLLFFFNLILSSLYLS